MATHKSAEKRARQSVKRSLRNKTVISAVKTFEKKLVKSIVAKSNDVEANLKLAMSHLMKAVSKGVLKKETASRRISRLSTRVSQLAKK